MCKARIRGGRGRFTINYHKRGGHHRCRLTIRLRADDLGVLHHMQAMVGTGVVRLDGNRPRGHPQATWEVTSRDGVRRVMEILDSVELRTKKARDYAIWREAAGVWNLRDAPAPARS